MKLQPLTMPTTISKLSFILQLDSLKTSTGTSAAFSTLTPIQNHMQTLNILRHCNQFTEFKPAVIISDNQSEASAVMLQFYTIKW